MFTNLEIPIDSSLGQSQNQFSVPVSPPRSCASVVGQHEHAPGAANSANLLFANSDAFVSS